MCLIAYCCDAHTLTHPLPTPLPPPPPKIINRRRLEAGDAMQPITYYIDPTVPPEWRSAFKAGVEAWQPAFKAAGFGPKAIRAVLPGDEDWPEDYQVGGSLNGRQSTVADDIHAC
jgi:hypothetical protein